MADTFKGATFSALWPAAPGRFRVALYKGAFQVSPIVYRQERFSDHRTLGAAVRRLAFVLNVQGKSGHKGERIDAAHIVLPCGERLTLAEARERLARQAPGLCTARPDPYEGEPRVVACLLRTDTPYLTFADERPDSAPHNTRIRYAMLGGNYGWLHNSAGDIRFWDSASGARAGMKRAGYPGEKRP